MNFLISAAAVAALAAGVPTLAQTKPAPAQHPKAAKATTRAEMTQKVQQHFAKVDANHDGFVTKAEAETAGDAVHDRVEKRLDKRGEALFGRLDTNKNGSVTKAEAEAVFAAHKPKPGNKARKPDWDRFAARIDTNKDGAISRAEFEAVQTKRANRVADVMEHRGMASRMLKTADTNKDGKLSLAEATASAAADFSRLDTNRDGKLTSDEIRAARKAARAAKPGRR
ncbi:MAG TPA: hypothetical protein VFI88_07280 [Sphingomicrobium sp.]|jgi:Ca2+-binding EF-hand superfamily protein|nr:hypothetical protein [Sphingomicrobium sp.]